MRDRSYVCKRFAFDDAMAAYLVSILDIPPADTRKILGGICEPISRYLSESQMLSLEPAESRAQIRKDFQEMEQLSTKLAQHLDNLDPLNTAGRLVDAVAFEIEKESDLPDISHLEGDEWTSASLAQSEWLDAVADTEVATLRVSLERLSRGLHLLNQRQRPIEKGRPHKVREVMLIKDIADEYRKVTGRAPSAAKEGYFHAFVVGVFQAMGLDQNDCSRVLARALAIPPD